MNSFGMQRAELGPALPTAAPSVDYLDEEAWACASGACTHIIAGQRGSGERSSAPMVASCRRSGCALLPKSALFTAEGRGLDLHGKRVLIVEDDFLTAESFSHTIADYGFTVVGPVDTADRAVRLIGQELPDGALLDVGLRDGKAVEVAKALRARGVPFIIVTGYSRDSLPPELKRAPFVAKPMTESALIDTARRTF